MTRAGASAVRVTLFTQTLPQCQRDRTDEQGRRKPTRKGRRFRAPSTVAP
jgi:hypothetical protein